MKEEHVNFFSVGNLKKEKLMRIINRIEKLEIYPRAANDFLGFPADVDSLAAEEVKEAMQVLAMANNTIVSIIEELEALEELISPSVVNTPWVTVSPKEEELDYSEVFDENQETDPDPEEDALERREREDFITPYGNIVTVNPDNFKVSYDPSGAAPINSTSSKVYSFGHAAAKIKAYLGEDDPTISYKEKLSYIKNIIDNASDFASVATKGYVNQATKIDD